MSGKRHHFIPQFLQRGFASHSTKKDFYTWVYIKNGVTPFNTNILNVGIEGYFYAEEKESTLDDIITNAEAEYAPFIDELRRNDGSQKIDNKRAANLIAHLESRTKNLRESLRKAGTLMLEEITNYLQVSSNSEKFVKKQVALEAGKIIDQELERLKIPRSLLPIFRQQYTPLVNAKIPEMTENMVRTMAQLSQNIEGLLENSAKSGHIKALLSNHAPPIKASVYEKLRYQVLLTGDLTIPLGDSAVIFHIEGKKAFTPYFEVDKKLLAVLLPISSNRLLIGSTKNYQLNQNDINLAIASCSLDYFISSKQNSENEVLAKNISTTATMISETEMEDILSEIVMKI